MKIRVVAALFIIGLLTVLVGCGGSGDSGPLFNPDELEVMTALDAFSAAIRDEDRYLALNWVDGNLKWGSQSNPMLHDKFSERLRDFFKNNQVNDFRFDNMGVSIFEDIATVRAQLVCKYVKSGETDVTSLTESVELKLEKKPKWGILEMYPSASVNLKFPPE